MTSLSSVVPSPIALFGVGRHEDVPLAAFLIPDPCPWSLADTW
jgi:hypothetical protein